MMTKKKKIVVFSIFTLSLAAAAAILDIFSQSSFWKKKTKKKIQLLKEEEEEEEKPNPEGGGGGGGSASTSATITPGGPDDRISELPKEILQHILGFLEMDELLIGTSLVSTKWRYLWKSVPVLTFNSVGSLRNNTEKYYNFVDNVLRLRDSSKIEIFNCFNSSCQNGLLERFHNFIVSAAVNHGAQEIQVQAFYLKEEEEEEESSNIIIVHFSPSIFKSGLLRKFTFNVITCDFLFQFPRSMCCATHLTHLSLAGIRLPEGDDDDDDARLHLVCPVLETLLMRWCDSKHLKVLDISAPRLDTLSIDNMRFGGSDFLGGCRIELGGCRIEIRTPNLISLNYSGCVYVDCFTENLSRIADASLDFTKEPGMVVEQTTSFAIKLLKGLTSAKSLTLGGFEVFSQVVLTPFTNLRTLKLVTTCCNISSIHGMMHILNSCKSIEKFVWEVDEVGIKHKYIYERLMLPRCRLSHLKHVHIKRLYGHGYQIEFVKFLLKSSVVLEDLIINTTKNSPKRLMEEDLKQFLEEKPSFRSIKLQIL